MRSPLTLVHLDRPCIRERLLTLWQDEQNSLMGLPPENWPYGSRLSPIGWAAYPSLFSHAVREEDMSWLAQQLASRDYWIRYWIQNRRSGPVRVTVNPVDEAAKLGYGEFNIAYVRAVLAVAAEEGRTLCTVVRAGTAAIPRWECSCMEGAEVSVSEVLAGHRAYARPGSSEISIPSAPNCHHTVFIPAWTVEQSDLLTAGETVTAAP